MTTLVDVTLPVSTVPIKFLGATVLSMNCRMGWGIESSSLEIDLVEDCIAGSGYNVFTETIDNFGPDNFIGDNQEIIGSAAYFSLPAPNPSLPNDKFRFGGIITNWTTRLGANGLTYHVSMSDPKQILDNTIVITDSYSDLPFQHINYYNVYSAYEAGVNYGNCNVFGEANSTERGMEYNKVLKGLLALAALAGDTTNFRLKVYSPTTNSVGYGGLFRLDLGYTLSSNNIYTANLVQSRPDSVPLGPDNYRITDKMSILELLNNICELTGRNFYCNLVWDVPTSSHKIVVSTVQFAPPLGGLAVIPASYKGYATELSYGKELRNDKSRKIIFGEQIHYLTTTNRFTPYFGEDDFGNPIYPIENNKGVFCEPDGNTDSICGFWIYIDITKLNVTLYNPITTAGGNRVYKVWLSEADIRAALSSYQLWLIRTFQKRTTDPQHYSNIDGSLVKILQNAPIYKDFVEDRWADKLVDLIRRDDPDNNKFDSRRQPINDILLDARRKWVDSYKTDFVDDLDKIHKFISNLGQTYYGKQFLTALTNRVCGRWNNEEGGGNGFGELMYSEVPTNDGGWVDYGFPVLSLVDPALSVFRNDDDRIRPFAVFHTASNTAASGVLIGSPANSGIANPPTDPTYSP